MVFKVLASALVLVLAAGTPSCGGSVSGDQDGGTDSNTHWLDTCNRDADCEMLDCVCGICTKRCSGDDACAALGPAAACAEPSACEAADAETACVALCSDVADCPSAAFDCVAGQCMRRADPATPSDAGATPNCEGVACTTDDCQEGYEEYVPPGACCKSCRPLDSCRAMVAFDSGDDCAAVAGYAYDGRACYPIQCGCAGADCDQIAPTLAQCAQEHLGCEDAVSTECARHADCAITPAGCCGPCGVPDFDSVVALTASTVAAHKDAVCRTGEACPDCVSSDNPTLYAACDAGTCVAIDATPFAECSSDDDCTVRARDCCECGADLTALVAVSDPSGYAAMACEGVSGCDGCLPTYPADVTAMCDAGRCVLQ